jgi:uncharacterized membrane protein (DUF4010 family)
MNPVDAVMVRQLAAALAVGLLIGIERGWRQRSATDGTRVSGLRTFTLLGLAGGIAALLPGAMAAAIGIAVFASLVVGYRAALQRQEDLSVTGTLVGVVTFSLGFMAGRGMVSEALAAAAVVTLLLSARGRAHAILRGMTETEVQSIARFALVALVILPLLPDADYGPYQAWNPRQIWMVVVIVLGLSFAGYVAARRLGPDRGIMITALCGALVSSTAVTAAYARRLREGDGPVGALIAGIALASLVMFVRVLVLTAALVPFALASLAVAMLPALAVGAVTTLLALRAKRDQSGGGEIGLGNPLDFRPALILAALVAVMSLVSRWAGERFGGEGVSVALGLTGLMDVDAAVITLSNMPEGVFTARGAGLVLAVPVLANTIFKALLALTLAGPRGNGWRAAAPLIASVCASGVGIAVAAAV